MSQWVLWLWVVIIGVGHIALTIRIIAPGTRSGYEGKTDGCVKAGMELTEVNYNVR
jgi:hypothetical protein